MEEAEQESFEEWRCNLTFRSARTRSSKMPLRGQCCVPDSFDVRTHECEAHPGLGDIVRWTVVFFLINFSIPACIELKACVSGGDGDLSFVALPLLAMPVYWLVAALAAWRKVH